MQCVLKLGLGKPMLGEILAHIVGEAVFSRLTESERSRVVARVSFGLLGAVLGIAGALHFALRVRPITNTPVHASMVALFLCLACFFLLNVALHKRWRWPAVGFVLSFIALFVTRILFGP